ncbi:MAG TPA: hypothetical protein ENK84_05000, partial [Desulfobulbus sp.]|nr:hypothetical protein [Desulfobulbus sp.]
MKRKLLIVVLALLILVPTLLFFRLQITTFILTRALIHAGLSNIELELADLGSRNMHLGRLTCVLPGSGGSIILQNGVLDWNRSLLRDKQLNTINIDSLAVELPRKTNATSSRKISIQQIVENISSQLQKLPFKELHIARLIINGKAAGPITGRELTLDLHKNGKKIFAGLLLVKEKLRLALDAADPNRWRLGVVGPIQDAPFLSADFHLSSARLQGEITAELSRLKTLNPLLKTPLPKLAGKLSATVAVSLNKKNTADIELHLQQPVFADWSAASIRLELHGLPGSPGQVLLGQHSGMHIVNLQKDTLSIDDLTIDLDGRLTRTKDFLQYVFAEQSMISTRGINSPKLQVSSIRLPAAIDATITGNKITLKLPAKQQFLLTDFHTKTLSIPKARLTPTQDTDISLLINKDFPWTIAPGHWQCNLTAVRRDNMILEPAPIDIDMQRLAGRAKDWRIQTSITCSESHLSDKNNGLTVENISMELKGGLEKIEGTGSWSLHGIPGVLAL